MYQPTFYFFGQEDELPAAGHNAVLLTIDACARESYIRAGTVTAWPHLRPSQEEAASTRNPAGRLSAVRSSSRPCAILHRIGTAALPFATPCACYDIALGDRSNRAHRTEVCLQAPFFVPDLSAIAHERKFCPSPSALGGPAFASAFHLQSFWRRSSFRFLAATPRPSALGRRL